MLTEHLLGASGSRRRNRIAFVISPRSFPPSVDGENAEAERRGVEGQWQLCGGCERGCQAPGERWFH